MFHMSYEEYLDIFEMRPCRASWIEWMIDVWKFSREEAVVVANDPKWRYDFYVS